MADNDWTITTRESDEVQLLVDGRVREITRVRFWIGSHGPFDRVFDRGTPAIAVEQAIREKRDELQRRAQL